jgi:hypothetical protein
MDVFWRDELLFTRASLVSNKFSVVSSISREIVWELFNTNFALELLATDRVIHPREENDLHSALGRDALVADCIPDKVMIRLGFPTEDKGLGALHWRERIECLEAFRVLLSSWTGNEATQLKVMAAVAESSSEEYVAQVERLAYRFYCQTFFDYFGRAPCVPCQLPPR